jgi:hypothetical protein
LGLVDEIAAPIGILFLGLLTGLRHSMEADHIAAVSTIVLTNNNNNNNKLSRAPLLGALWGLGHTASLFAAGLIVLLLAVNIPQKISNTLEFGVGIMLVYLALTALTGFNIGKIIRILSLHDKVHRHPHTHQDRGIIHSHDHHHNEKEHRHGHKALFVGMVHGMAGSGALMLAVLSTINSLPLGLGYIAIFGAGSILSMMGISTMIGLPFVRAKKYVRLSVLLRYLTGITSLVIGVRLMYDLGVVQQIFIK